MIAVILAADGCNGAGIVGSHTAHFAVGIHCHTEVHSCALALLIGGQQRTVLVVDDHAEVLEVSSRSCLCHSQHRQEYHEQLLHLFR